MTEDFISSVKRSNEELKERKSNFGFVEYKSKQLTSSSSHNSNSSHHDDDHQHGKRNIFQRCVDSFKPPLDGSFDTSNLKRTLKPRHLIMIAIGGSIGTGLFVGSGKAIAEGGPLGVVIGWAIAGSQIIGTIHGLGEITVRFPVVGAFANYGTRFLDPSISFVVSTIYVLQWFFVLPLSLIHI